MNDIDELQKNYLKIIDNIKIDELTQFSLKKILFNETFYVQKMTRKKSIYNFIISSFIFPVKINFNNNNNNIILISNRWNRKDHDSYWNKIKKCFNNYSEISILSYENIYDILKNFHLIKGMVHFIKKIRLLKQLKEFKEFKTRLYFTSKVYQIIQYKEMLEMSRIEGKVAICFFDSEFFSNIVMQYFKNKGAFTITNQHGQPLFRSFKEDLLNQSQIINFSCDYFMAKGEFTKKQFISAGFAPDKIVVIGSFNKDDKKTSYRSNKTNTFALFLDCPTYDFAYTINQRLLDMAYGICKELNYKCVIKLHPVDNISNYKIETCSNIRLENKNVKIKDICNKIEFGILHASAVYLDLMENNTKAYKYESEINFPIVDCENDKFTNIQMLKKNFYEWKQASDLQKQGYFESLRRNYSCSVNTEQKYIEFVEQLLKGEK